MLKTTAALASLSLGFAFNFNLLADTPDARESAARAGKADAIFEVGSIALLEHDYPKAFKWLSKGTEAKHGPSEAALGFMYFNGFGCDKDIAAARKLYEQSAAAGAHQGFNNLAHLYRFGLGGLQKDLPKAVELLEKAAGLGNEYAVNTLAKMYMGNELGTPDNAKILEWLRFGAKRKYRGCLSDLGFAYQHGIGLKKDIQKAVELYQESIDLGSAGGKSNLGYLYLMGEGVPRDYPKAMKLFKEAAEENDIGATINLAVMRINGLGCDRDPEGAFSLLEKAKGLGSEQAAQMLGAWKATEIDRKK